MKFLRLLRAAAPLVLLSAFTSAAIGATTARIRTAIDSAQRSSVPGNVSPRAKIAADLGEAAADTRIESMSLRFNMTDAQQAALTNLLIAQQTPGSASYHQWLTPEQFNAQFGLSADDLAKVSAWLTSQGFTVTQVARGGQFIRFSGTVGQANQAFGVKLHNVNLNGQQHFANLEEPSLPAVIASVTRAVTGLNNFRARPHFVRRNVQGATVTSGDSVRPNFTSSVSGNHYVVPADFHTIYDENGLLSSGINGSGIKIAVVGQSDINAGDVTTFRSLSGLGANAPTVVLYGPDPGVPLGSDGYADDQLESELDVEWAGAVAPSASVIFVNSTDVLNTSLADAVDNNVASIISDSYGNCEVDLGASFIASINQILSQAAAQGITVTASSGDDGASDCDYTGTVATGGLAVDFPASSPYVTGLGGTEFSEGSGTYWAASSAANGESALSYIPETVWNDDATARSNGATTLSAAGGGASTVFSKPSWQAGTGVPNDGKRDVPDVALATSEYHDGFIICASGDCTNGFRDQSQLLDVVGGTSVAAPSFAGLLALVEQKTGQRLGAANAAIYSLAQGQYAANVFHDVTSGTNASPCRLGTPNCSGGVTTGFTAGVGYDQTTGWGSVDAYNLVNYWALQSSGASTIGTTKSVTTLTGSASSVTVGTSVTLTATVASGSTGQTATPTGTVQFSLDNVSVGSPVALSGGTATYNLSTTSRLRRPRQVSPRTPERRRVESPSQ